jgi:hypothetical protein
VPFLFVPFLWPSKEKGLARGETGKKFQIMGLTSVSGRNVFQSSRMWHHPDSP